MEVKHITIIISIVMFWELLGDPSSVEKFKSQCLFLEYEIFIYFKAQFEYSHQPGQHLDNLPIQKFLTSLIHMYQLSFLPFAILNLTSILWTGVLCFMSWSYFALYYLFPFQLIFFLWDAIIWTFTITHLVVCEVFLFF